MKIYFSASVQYKKKYGRYYRKIVNYLERNGHEVFTEVLAEHLPDFSQIPTKKLQEWQLQWSSYVSACDFALIEGSYPSTVHIGFEIGVILSRGKPVVLLYQQGKDPVFINNYTSKRLIKSEYTEDDLYDVINWSLEEVDKISQRRFTFFISSKIDEFLLKITKKKGISRSEFIRQLIECEIRKQIQ